jgi:hypothetical protein
MRRVSILLVSAALVPAASQAQISMGNSQGTDYKALYGDPQEVSLDDLVLDSAVYEGRAVRTKGRLDYGRAEGASTGTNRVYSLQGGFARSVTISPVNEIAGPFQDQAPQLLGQQVEITGVVVARPRQVSPLLIQFWAFLGPEERKERPITGKVVPLEEVVSKAGRMDGKTIRVVGKFRGRNLYGDLPSKSELSSADWVIKDDVFAVWVTGKKPKGMGWALDAGLKRDTGKWIDVLGTVETKAGVTYLHAKSVALTEPPRPTADAQPPPPPKEKPKVPPSLVFALPLDGDDEVPRDSRFVIQFSKDMDSKTFGGHVGLRYVGPHRPGDRQFDGLRVSYDDGLRALTIDPGDQLRSGRELEVVLLGGILDIDGLELVPRKGDVHDGVVDVLRYRVNPY